jgi:hypothetical protein
MILNIISHKKTQQKVFSMSKHKKWQHDYTASIFKKFDDFYE